jgi:hypothetical protein
MGLASEIEGFRDEVNFLAVARIQIAVQQALERVIDELVFCELLLILFHVTVKIGHSYSWGIGWGVDGLLRWKKWRWKTGSEVKITSPHSQLLAGADGVAAQAVLLF